MTGEVGAGLRVLVIGVNYRPELTAVGSHTARLAEQLVARGDEVTVLTGLPHFLTMPDAGPRMLARC